MSEVKREIFLDDLPRWKEGKNKGSINWVLSIGNKVTGIYDTLKFEIEIIDYKEKYLYIKYLDKISRICTDSFKNCKLGKVLGVFTREFRYNIGDIIGKSKTLTITNRKYNSKYNKDDSKYNEKWYKYTCNKCGWTEGWIRESNLKRGQGCSCCRGLTMVEGINTLWDKARWMCDLGVSEEDAKTHTPQSNNKITVTCPDCGKVRMKIISEIYKNSSISCSCSDKYSYPSKFMNSVLEQLEIDFITEYSPKWCKYVGYNDSDNIKIGRYDFLLKNINIDNRKVIIETDGAFHSKDNKMRDTTKDESKYIDSYKDRLAKENGYEVIRIDCEKSELEFIKQNIINSKLNELFDLSKIDWTEVEKFALKNRVKECCEYWNDGIKSVKEISKIMKLSADTIRVYLKQGNGIWCNYNAKEELSKNGLRNGKPKKQVKIFKDSVLLGIFSSCHELERKSEEIFGIKITHRRISDVCLGRLKQYRGYTFEYTEHTDIIV